MTGRESDRVNRSTQASMLGALSVFAEETDLILLWGSNARETHPMFFHGLLKGVRNGARMIAVDPRRTCSTEWADLWLGLEVGSDIALATALPPPASSGGEIVRPTPGRGTLH